MSVGGTGECSQASEVLSTDSSPPDAPTEAPVVQITGIPTRAALSWHLPQWNRNTPITHFIVVVHCVAVDGGVPIDTGDEHWEVRTDGARTSHTITGLIAGASYEFSLKVASAVGISEPSPVTVYHTGPRAPAAPGAPRFQGPSSVEPYDPVLSFMAPKDERIQCYRFAMFSQGTNTSVVSSPVARCVTKQVRCVGGRTRWDLVTRTRGSNVRSLRRSGPFDSDCFVSCGGNVLCCVALCYVEFVCVTSRVTPLEHC